MLTAWMLVISQARCDNSPFAAPGSEWPNFEKSD